MPRRTMPWPALPSLQRHRDFLSHRAGGPRPALPGTPLARVLCRLPVAPAGPVTLAITATLVLALRHSLHAHASVLRQRFAPARPLPVPLHTQQLTRLQHERHTVWHEPVSHPDRTLLRVVPAAPPRREHEAVPATAASRGLHAPARHAYPPMATAIAQPAAVRAAARREHRAPATGTVEPVGVQAARAAAPAPAAVGGWPPPPLELARLAASVGQQVLQQLERRALSARERSGRL